jgi:hypothetical protein
MKVILVTCSDDRSGRKNGIYGKTQDKIYDFFKNKNSSFGITNFLFVKYNDILKTDFYKENKILLDNKDAAMNGRCYKPYSILEGLHKIDYDDFLIYNDCSPELWGFIENHPKINPKKYNINVIKNLCIQNGGILTSYVNVQLETTNENYHRHEFYTLDCCMKKMALEQYKYSLQHASGMIVLQKTQKSIEFVQEWLKYNLIDECASLGNVYEDPEKTIPNFWIEECLLKSGHRHDQSISGLLINKMNNDLIVGPNNNYPTYNFLTYCIVNQRYRRVNSNQPKTINVMRTVFNEEKNTHETRIFPR